ncbi:MAG: TetR/AcrR family transcriptional regulator [Nocardioidaceae bacterium]|nr:TetR/AcrR family transcriptional regulator [Nocardioidaceae bacterium]
MSISPLDRRPPGRGDERRAALLGALDDLLRDGVDLDEINVADLSKRAGVTRSAFYFYFENKEFAAAALMDEVYADAAEITTALVGQAGTPRERIEATIRGLFDTLDRHLHLYKAMLDARGRHAGVRELWERDRRSFVPLVADMIRAERASGTAAPGADPDALAWVLLDLNDRAMERRARGDGPETDQHVEALVSIWLRSIYGTGADA